jgi:hypothetical protein
MRSLRDKLKMKALDLQRRETQKRAAPRSRQPRSESYVPPGNELVRISTLDDLIARIRTVTPEQQARLQPDSRLWFAGDISLLHGKCVAVVGTREISSDGAARSRRLARELATAGLVVVSGLARGWTQRP